MQESTETVEVTDRGRRGRARGYAILFGGLILMVEIVSLAAIPLLNPRLDEPILRRAAIYADQSALIVDFLSKVDEKRDLVDPDLGWSYRPGFAVEGEQVSGQGLRDTRVFEDQPPPGALRVAAFGDSFVYGTEVANQDAWTAQLDQLLPHAEILNYGVGGYGTDQALLRFRREGMLLHPHVVLIGFAPPDLRRVTNVYRRFISVMGAMVLNERRVHGSRGLTVKPRFRLIDEGELELLPSPIATAEDWRVYLDRPEAITTLGEHDGWYEPLVYENPLYDYSAAVRLAVTVWIRVKRRYLSPDRLLRAGVFNTESEAFKIQVLVLHTFAREVEASGAVPIILFLPDPPAVSAVRSGSGTSYQPLVDAVARRGWQTWDAVEAFAETRDDGLFMPGSHYSPSGNRVVASWLADRLGELEIPVDSVPVPRNIGDR